MLLVAQKHLFHPCLIAFAACLQASFSLEVFIVVGKIVVDTNHTPDRQFSYSFIVLNFAISGLSYGVDDQSLKDVFSGFGDVVDGKFGLLSFVFSLLCTVATTLTISISKKSKRKKNHLSSHH